MDLKINVMKYVINIFKNIRTLNIIINYGIKRTKGEYILPLDNDDLISDNTLELLVNFLDEHEEIDLAAYRYILFYEDGTKKERPVYKR